MSDDDIRKLVREFRAVVSTELEAVHIRLDEVHTRLDRVGAQLGAIERTLVLHTELILNHQH